MVSTLAIAAEPPLEYSFEVGDRLVYERRTVVSSVSTGAAQQRRVEQIQIWCLATDDDEALLLLDTICVIDGRAEPMRGVVLHVDRLGRTRMPVVTQRRVHNFEGAFEVIPVQRSVMQDELGWRTPADAFAHQQQCARGAPDPQRGGAICVDTTAIYPAGIGDLLDRSKTGRYWFDAATGLVIRAESLETDRLVDEQTRAVTVLRQRQRKPASLGASASRGSASISPGAAE